MICAGATPKSRATSATGTPSRACRYGTSSSMRATWLCARIVMSGTSRVLELGERRQPPYDGLPHVRRAPATTTSGPYETSSSASVEPEAYGHLDLGSTRRRPARGASPADAASRPCRPGRGRRPGCSAGPARGWRPAAARRGRRVARSRRAGRAARPRPTMRDTRNIRGAPRSRSWPTTYQWPCHDPIPHGSKVRVVVSIAPAAR